MTKKLPSLLDLAPPAHEIVELTRGPVAVFGVSMSSIAAILRDHPEIADMASGARAKGGAVSFSIADLAARFPSLALDIAAHACRVDFDSDEYNVLMTLEAGDILDIVLTAVDLSAKGGLKGFFGRFSSKADLHGLAAEAKAADPKSRMPAGEAILNPSA